MPDIGISPPELFDYRDRAQLFESIAGVYPINANLTEFATELLGAFASLALLLAAIGIYGVMAFVVGQRTREIGIRIALGAQPRAVVRLIPGQALALAIAGVVLGGIGAIFLSRLLSGMLFEVRATDPMTYVGIALLLAVTAGLAAWRPARRAAGVDPMIALRAE